MAFYTYSEENAKKVGSGTGVITDTGIYPVTLKLCSLKVSDGGATSLNFSFEGSAGGCSVYGLTIFNKDGKKNEINSPKLDALLKIADISELDDPEPRTVKFGTQEVELLVFDQLCDIELYVALRKNFTKYKGQIKESLEVMNFFDVNGRSAKEIIDEVEEPVAMDKLSKILTDKYGKDENDKPVTKEEVDAWIAAGKPDGKDKTKGVTPKQQMEASKTVNSPFKK